MALELRKVKIHDDMSEETTCFSAEMWEDGIHIGWVKNDGRGGCDLITPTEGNREKTNKYEEDYRKEVNRENFPIPYLLNDWDITTRKQSKALVLRKGEQYSTLSLNISIAKCKKNPKNMERLMATVEKYKAQGFTILNRNL